MKRAHKQASPFRLSWYFSHGQSRKKKIDHDIADNIEEYVQEIVSTSL